MVAHNRGVDSEQELVCASKVARGRPRATRVERTSPRVSAKSSHTEKDFGGEMKRTFGEGHKQHGARALNSRTRKSFMCDQRRHARRLALKDIKREPHAHGGAEERPGGTVGGLWRPSYRVK